MSSWVSGYLNVDEVRLHYTRTGGEKPSILLAHGVTDDGLCWTPVAVALAPKYDVIMLDARGHGRSDAPETGYGPIEQAGDLAGAIQALNLHKPAVLGHSMGAVTALVHAGLYPEQPSRVILEDPPGWWAPSTQNIPADADPRAAFREWFAEIKNKTRAELIEEQKTEAPKWSDEELGPWADAKLRVHDNVLSIFQLQTIENVDWESVLTQIRAPLLVITADPKLGAALTSEGAAALKEYMPHLREEHISEAGHNIRREQFKRYIEVVFDFLEDTH